MSNDITNEKVGYKKPPKKSQFKKGKSGNPKGRPRKSDNLNLYDVCINILNEPVVISENGKKRTINKNEAFIRSLYSQSLKGKGTHTKLLLELIKKQVIPYQQKEEKRRKIDNEEDYTDPMQAARHYREMIRNLENNSDD